MNETDINVLDMVGVEQKSDEPDASKKMEGSVQITIYRRNGKHATKNIEHLKGIPEMVEENFPALVQQIRGSVRSESESIALVLKTLCILQESTNALSGDSMVEYAIKKINKEKAKQDQA